MRRFGCTSLVVAVLMSSGCSWIHEQRFISGVMNKPAHDFELTALDGGKVRLGELRGRPVLLAFWAWG